MKLLQGQGAIDELGLGRIRDAFSNTLFPGMSTLQTRAKYFLLMPALYSFLERNRISDARDARAKVREYEISFTRRLLEGSSSDNLWGIIGADSLHNRDNYVKYDPAYVYHAGMETYGLIKTGGNLYQMIAERSRAFRNTPAKIKTTEGTDGDSDDLNNERQIFLTCGENYDFKSKDPLSISLTSREAGFLARQIIIQTPGSLIGYLLDSGLYKTAIQYDFESLEFILKNNLPKDLYRIYILARRFARFAYLLRIRYALLYDIGVGSEKAVEEENSFFKWLNRYQEEFYPEAIEEIINFASSRVSEESCKTFCLKASRLITERNWDALDETIVRREVETKTLKRSKLKNAKDFEPGKPFEIAGLMSFRWNSIVRNILKEIKEGLENE